MVYVRRVFTGVRLRTWPISPTEYYRADQIVIEDCVVKNQGTHVLTSQFLTSTDVTATAALLLQADNVTVIGGNVGPTATVGLSNKGPTGDTENFHIRGTGRTTGSLDFIERPLIQRNMQ